MAMLFQSGVSSVVRFFEVGGRSKSVTLIELLKREKRLGLQVPYPAPARRARPVLF